jgi:3-oxoacyl-[acyl-carrier-protein] synthase II
VDDDAEATALAAVLPRALVTTPKTATGDCEAASGLMNAVVGALAIRDGIVPSTPRRAAQAVTDVNLATGDIAHDIHTVLALDATPGSGCVATVLVGTEGAQ